jgi:hypothetical protein
MSTNNKISKITAKQFVRTLKEEGCCEWCGEQHPATLQFHHREPSEKSYDIRYMMNGGWSIKRLSEEIAKCDLICANCHLIHHWNETAKDC